MAAAEHEVSGTSSRPAGPAPEHEPPAHRDRLRGRLGRWVTSAEVTIVVVALAAVLLARAGLSAGGGGASPSWQPYHDPFGLFTLRVPPGWTAHFAPTTGTFGDRYGSETARVDQVTFDDPAQGTGSAFMWIIAHLIRTTFDHQLYCQQPANLQPYAPTTLSSLEPAGVWFFTTETASFQVDVGIPGVVMPTTFGPPPPPATPIPVTWATTDKTEVNALLVSFQPTDPKPLAC